MMTVTPAPLYSIRESITLGIKYLDEHGVEIPPDLILRAQQVGVMDIPVKGLEVLHNSVKSALYEQNIYQLGDDLYNGRKTEDEYKAAMLILIALFLYSAWHEGMVLAGMSPLEMTDDMKAELQTEIDNEAGYVAGLATAITAASQAKKPLDVLNYRFTMWTNRYVDIKNRAVISAGLQVGGKYVWRLGATEKHCKDCFGYNGKVKTAEAWDKIYKTRGHRPQSERLECKGYNCDCELMKVRDVY